MKLKTVNIIEITNGNLQNIESFSDDDDGNKEAEKLFTAKALENGANSDDIDSYLDDGIFSEDAYELLITHSL